jgi:PAS domain S-box-containing protein
MSRVVVFFWEHTVNNDGDNAILVRHLQESLVQRQVEIAYLQNRFRTMLNTWSDMVFILDHNGKFQFNNNAAVAVTGVTPENSLGKTFYDIFPPDVASHLEKHLRRAFADGKAFEETPPFLLPPKNLWVNCHMVPMRRMDDSVESVFVAIRDVTEQKLAENALKESEERFRQIVEQMPDPVLVMAPNGTVVMANASFLETMKIREASSIVGKLNVLSDAGAERLGVVDEVRKAFSGAIAFLPELVILPGNAQDTPAEDSESALCVDATIFPVYLRPGDVFQVVAIFTDVTERKRAEQALRQSNTKARTQYKSFPIPTFTWQRLLDDFVLVDYNDAAVEFSLGGVANVVGRKLSDVFKSQPVVPEDMGQCVRDRSILRKKTSFRFPVSGTEMLLLLTYVFVEPDLVMVHAEDVTEKEKMEAEIHRAEHLEALGDLAGGIAHDFNNLLAGIFGYVGLAREFGKHDEKIKECLDKAQAVFGQAKSLTQQLLTFAKGGSPVRKVASISELLRDLSSFALSGTNVKPELLVSDDLWSCEVDIGQFGEVINNCVINARQAMPDGGIVTIGAENVTLSARDAVPLSPGRYVRIYIQDRGTGIPKHLLARVLDPFFTTKQTGTGLGLTIAYSIVKRHHGYLEITSQEGVGTLVNMYLPASVERPSERADNLPAPRPERGRVLLMDDEVFVLDAMRGVVESIGFTVVTATGGAEAVKTFVDEKAAGRAFDAVILDLTIPGGFGGKQVLSELRAHDPAVKAIATSGYSEDPVMSEPRDFGFVAALRKPYTIQELAGILREVTGDTSS